MGAVRGQERATVDVLYRTSGKAELVKGEVVRMSTTGAKPGAAAVDLLSEDAVRAYRASNPDAPVVNGRGETA